MLGFLLYVLIGAIFATFVYIEADINNPRERRISALLAMLAWPVVVGVLVCTVLLIFCMLCLGSVGTFIKRALTDDRPENT
jgi:uncharacterized membrane protein YciS (DUF1049 family)